MSECRNCGSIVLEDLGFVGDVAPFFLKRVLHLEAGFATGSGPIVRMVRRRTKLLRRLFSKLYRPTVLVELQVCTSCSFLQTKFPFPDSAIKNLYKDYRSDSYNEERTRFEPSYANFAKDVGINEREIQNRVVSLTAWLGSKIQSTDQPSMLDYGGADGRFLPRLPGAKYVFEVSNIAPSPGVVRIESESAMSTYSYIQLAHVLEHVPHPLDLVRHVCTFLDTGGYLYIEVPQELDETTLTRLRSPDKRTSIGIHEHINRYIPQGIVALLRAAGLVTVSVETEMVDLVWTRALIIRGLARKMPN